MQSVVVFIVRVIGSDWMVTEKEEGGVPLKIIVHSPASGSQLPLLTPQPLPAGFVISEK